MHTSSQHAFLALRLGLVAVFFWFGIDMFLQPTYWANAWVPHWFLTILPHIHLSVIQYIYLNAIFEILIGLSFLSDIFTKAFASLAALFIIAVMVSSHLTEVIMMNFGLLGSLTAIILWPRRNRF